MKRSLSPLGLFWVFLVLFFSACGPGGVSLGQGSLADYERAFSLDKRTRDKVFRDRVKPHWMPGNSSFWYRVETSRGKHECILVDAEKGTRTPGFVAPPTKLIAQQDDVPRRSTRTGDETSMVFVNQTDGEMSLFWLDASGQRRSYGKLAAKGERQMHTFAGHVWLVVGANGEEMALVEAGDEASRIEIDGKLLLPKG